MMHCVQQFLHRGASENVPARQLLWRVIAPPIGMCWLGTRKGGGAQPEGISVLVSGDGQEDTRGELLAPPHTHTLGEVRAIAAHTVHGGAGQAQTVGTQAGLPASTLAALATTVHH